MAALYSAMVRSNAVGSSLSLPASSPIDPATMGGWSVRLIASMCAMPTVVWSPMKKAVWAWCFQIS